MPIRNKSFTGRHFSRTARKFSNASRIFRCHYNRKLSLFDDQPLRLEFVRAIFIGFEFVCDDVIGNNCEVAAPAICIVSIIVSRSYKKPVLGGSIRVDSCPPIGVNFRSRKFCYAHADFTAFQCSTIVSLWLKWAEVFLNIYFACPWATSNVVSYTARRSEQFSS